MKKCLIVMACFLFATVAMAQKDTVRVSVREYKFHYADYIAVFANGKVFMGDRDEFLKRLFPSSIEQPKDKNIVVYPYVTDTANPYRIAVRNRSGFWEVALWAPYLPTIGKYAIGIVFTYDESEYKYRLINTMKEMGGVFYSRWHPSIVTGQFD